MGKRALGFEYDGILQCTILAALVLLATTLPGWGQSGEIVHADYDFADYVVDENAGSVEITGSITFSGTSNGGDYTISVISGSATNGVDYVHSGDIELSFVGNVLHFAMQIAIIDDTITEETETVFFDFLNIDSAVIGENTPARLRIIDNDSLGYIVVHRRGFIEEGDRLLLEVLAVNAAPPVTYRWFKDGNPVTNGVGATAPRLVIDPIATTDSGAYTVRIEDSSKALIEAGPFVVSVVQPGTLPATSASFLFATLLVVALWHARRRAILVGDA